jgi:organic hydroperoxide reductase OsmC/OhrA
MGRNADVTRFVEIVLRARVTVRDANRARALHALEKTEKRCVVSASLSTPVRLEAEIHERDSGKLAGRGASMVSSVEP